MTRCEDRFRKLLEAAPDAMVIVDRSGRIVLVNAQTEVLFGYPREELLGQPIAILIPEQFRDTHAVHVGEFFRTQRSRPMGSGRVLVARCRDGREVSVEISLSPLEDESGPQAIAAIRDVSERHKLEQEHARIAREKEAVRIREEFLSIASHELKTPLTALRLQLDGVVHAAQTGACERGVVLPRIEAMRASLGRIATLVDQLLDMSRISTGELRLHPEPMDLAALVRDVAARLGDAIGHAGCELRIQCDTPVWGTWDPIRVEQIVTNLLSNAVKYGAGKPIELRVAAEEGIARLTVRDYGIGIAPEDQARIFRRFERLIADRACGGFGLGLWIAQQVASGHGGSIQVRSQPGAGATFTVDLPYTALARPATDPHSCVMVVDDDAMVRDSFVDVLRDAGHKVVTAAHGGEALDLLRAGLRPRVIFLDLMMPVMDGRAFRSEQERDPQLASIPVVVVSAARDADRQAASIGAVSCLRKPFQLTSVIELITRYA